jgi:tRNA threonylcarbamoyladenosine biosynthesis protein TsaB
LHGLVIETSGRIGSVAITADGVVIAEDSFEHGLRHAAEMIPRIDRLARDRGLTPADLREIYVSVGPGSFTGLRIGITAAKTISFATGALIAAVPTVEVLAANAPAEARNVIVLLDAKRGQIFTARLARASAAEEWQMIEPAHLDSLAAILSRSPRPVHLIGEGIAYHQQDIPANDAGVIVTDPEIWRARAAATAKIGWRLLRDGHATDAHRLTPLYIRKPEAQEKAENAARIGS